MKAGLTGDEDVFEWYDVSNYVINYLLLLLYIILSLGFKHLFITIQSKVNLDEAMAMTDDLADLEWTGHFIGDIWKVNGYY